MDNLDFLQNKKLIDEILDHEDGTVKNASAIASEVTRTQVREEAFFRAVLPFEKITNNDLDYFGESELPGVWFELEPDTPAARTIPYNSTPNTFLYRAEKYVVLISVITTEEATKNVNELRTYKTDLRQIVTDNLLRDIHTEEDTTGVASVDRVVGPQVPLANFNDKEIQNVDMGQPIVRESIKRAISFLTDRRLPHGIFLLNQRTANEFLGWPRDEIGGDLAEKLLRGGLKALDEFKIFDIPFLSTIKSDLVPNGTMYQFTTRTFLGHALMLEDISVTIKREYDIIRARAQEQVGRSFGNVRGLQKLQFDIGN